MHCWPGPWQVSQAWLHWKHLMADEEKKNPGSHESTHWVSSRRGKLEGAWQLVHVELVPAHAPQTWLHLARGARILTWERVDRAATVRPWLVSTLRIKAEVEPEAAGLVMLSMETPYWPEGPWKRPETRTVLDELRVQVAGELKRPLQGKL